MSCKAQDWPNKKAGRTCCLSYPVKTKDYFRKTVRLNSEQDLYDFHKNDSQKQADIISTRQKRKILPDDFFRWMTKRGICPYGVISDNTKYWLELISMYDGEGGFVTPLPYTELPSIYFDVLSIVRSNRPIETPKETNGK